MKISNISTDITKELLETVATIDDAQAELLAEKIVKAKRIFLAGAGRSLLMVKCCAMRLMQLGFTAYVPGETVTPSITNVFSIVVPGIIFSFVTAPLPSLYTNFKSAVVILIELVFVFPSILVK